MVDICSEIKQAKSMDINAHFRVKLLYQKLFNGKKFIKLCTILFFPKLITLSKNGSK